MHAKGVINRFKLRYRKYLDTGDAFFEIKTKTSDHRTVKKRIQIESLTQGLEGSLDQFLNQNTKTNYENYQPVLTVYFNRVTLVNKYENERLTIDTEIYYTDNLKTVKRLDNIAIIEFKRDEFFKSSFEIILEQNEVEQSEMSKYCLGIKFLKKRVHNRSWSKINMLTDLPDFD
jgi:hypothetical protein